MFGFLIQCLKNFGIRGFFVYLNIKLGNTKSLHVPGIQFPISMRPTRVDRITFREIFFRKEYDIELPPSDKPRVIIDGGANIGFTSVFLANKYRGAIILSIEPDTENFEYLVSNTKPYPNITPLRSALWSKTEMTQVSDKGFGVRGFMIEKGSDGDTLQALSVHDLMRQFNLEYIDLLKMDIEGSEKEVFSENYESWLPVTKCLVIELHDRMKPGCSKAVFSALSNYDFSLSIRGENLVFYNNRFTGI